MVWMDQEQTETALPVTRTGLNWTEAQISDSSEEVEKWAENPDLGSPNIQ